jgi:hypothetical protein
MSSSLENVKGNVEKKNEKKIGKGCCVLLEK